MIDNSKNYLNNVLDDIFHLNEPKVDENRRKQVSGLIESTINGDITQSHLAINADLRENKTGAIVYILTNRRLIKIDIDTTEIESVSFPLDTLIGVERKLIDSNEAQIQISFQNGSFGLRYLFKDNKITDFFQKVDQSRFKEASNV